jgi:transposase InsO family protein
VLDTCSRRAVGWAIDARAGADLARNTLSTTINTRKPIAGAVIHGDHGPQFTSWTLTQRAHQARLLPPLGCIGDPYGNLVFESFWDRMKGDLLNRQR